jgi:hypothetical protein
MIPTPQTWLKIASKVMPNERSDWLQAMYSEFNEISSPSEKATFAFGCFKTAIFESARSRKGLNYIARWGGAIFIFVICIFGIFTAGSFGTEPESIAASRLIIILCLVYMCGAIFLITSLKNLRIYAGLGFGLAIASFVYCSLTRPNLASLPTEFLAAISIEAAGLMAALFLSTIYLRWLYVPSLNNA